MIARLNRDNQAGKSMPASALAPADAIDVWRIERPIGRATVPLTDVLAHSLGRSRDDIEIARTSLGRPYLTSRCGAGDRVHFSVSHAAHLSVVAIAGRRIGIDVESTDDGSSAIDAALRYLAAGERQAIEQAEPACRRLMLRTVWTRKEAYVKARGRGLRLGLDRFEVSAGRTPRLLSCVPYPRDPRRWTLCEVDVGGACVCTLAVLGGCGEIRIRDWRG